MKALEEDRQSYSQDVVWHALRVLLPPGPELERRARKASRASKPKAAKAARKTPKAPRAAAKKKAKG